MAGDDVLSSMALAILNKYLLKCPFLAKMNVLVVLSRSKYLESCSFDVKILGPMVFPTNQSIYSNELAVADDNSLCHVTKTTQYCFSRENL